MRINKLQFFLSFYFLFNYQLIVFAQIDKKTKDSLFYQMTFGKTDTAKVYANYEYGDLLVNINSDSAYYYFDKGKKLANKFNNPLLEAKSHSYIISLLNDNGKYKEALELCQNAEKLFIKAKATPKNFATVYINTANEWQYLGSFKNASNYFFKGLKISEKINNCIFQSVCINNLSSLYAEMKDTKNQLIFAKKGKQKAIECNDDYRIFSSSVNLIAAYLENNEFENARLELNILDKLKTKLNNPEYDLDLAITKADYYLKTKKYLLAIENYQIVLEKCKIYENIEYELSSAKQLAVIYFEQNNLDESLKFANKSLLLSKKAEAKTEEAEILKLFADIEEKKGNLKTSLYYRKKWEQITDIISFEESKKEILKLETEYQTEKKDLQIKNLNLKSKN